MKISNLSFPYPVLGIGDDVSPKPSFLRSPEVTSDKASYKFTAEFDMRNSSIHRLVKRGYAMYICEVTSINTLYRKCFTSQSPKFEIVIPKNHIGGRINFQFTITVISPISHYTNPEFHEDYKGFEFDLEPGDLLGFLGEYSYDVDIKYDKLKSVGSFMQITEGPTLSIPRFNFDNPKIDIQLPTAMYQQYKESIMGNPSFANIIHSSLVLNALVAAMLNFNNFENTLWARTIQYRVDTEATFADLRARNVLETLETDDIIELAQTLLSNPYGRLFNTLLLMGDASDNND